MKLHPTAGAAGRARLLVHWVIGAKLLTTFMAVLPADKPRYLITLLLDEPKGLPETHGFATSGWNAAPTAGRVIARIAPMLGIEPRFDLPPADQLILAKVRQ